MRVCGQVHMRACAYICVYCVRVYLCVCARACISVCVRACVCVHAWPSDHSCPASSASRPIEVLRSDERECEQKEHGADADENVFPQQAVARVSLTPITVLAALGWMSEGVIFLFLF